MAFLDKKITDLDFVSTPLNDDRIAIVNLGVTKQTSVDKFLQSVVADTGSFITNAAITNNTITYTRADSTTFTNTVLSASYSVSSSHARTAQSASSAFNATSASHAINSLSASSAVNAVSASHAISASYAISASHSEFADSSSYAVTASHVTNTYRETVTGSATYTITHNLGENFPIVQTYRTSDSRSVIPTYVEIQDANSIEVSYTTTFDGTIIVKK